ncbi:hypothetical protein CJ178_22950 [Rhodococcus sp. ACPA4]|nr:hypothetical protein CJ178_22950 [Rhodococcus sp. ACPA4]
MHKVRNRAGTSSFTYLDNDPADRTRRLARSQSRQVALELTHQEARIHLFEPAAVLVPVISPLAELRAASAEFSRGVTCL